MLLYPVTEVRKRIGFDDIPDVNAALEAGLQAATVYLSTTLRTGFERKTRSDLFYIPEAVQIGATYKVKLKLTDGFLTALPTVVASDRRATLVAGIDLTPDSLFDLEQGTLTILDQPLRGQFVQVEYTCGFEADDTDLTLYKQDQVPSWLKDAAYLQSLIVVDAASPNVRHDSNALPEVRAMKEQLATMLEQKVRYQPDALLPLL